MGPRWSLVLAIRIGIGDRPPSNKDNAVPSPERPFDGLFRYRMGELKAALRERASPDDRRRFSLAEEEMMRKLALAAAAVVVSRSLAWADDIRAVMEQANKRWLDAFNTALAAFEAFAAEGPKTVDVPRQKKIDEDWQGACGLVVSII
jgi:hypothetical protein